MKQGSPSVKGTQHIDVGKSEVLWHITGMCISVWEVKTSTCHYYIKDRLRSALIADIHMNKAGDQYEHVVIVSLSQLFYCILVQLTNNIGHILTA